MAKEKISALVDGGEATAGPPLGPRLGPLGINVGKLIADINEATKDFKGIKVPIDVIIDTEKKEWEIKVGSPPTSQLLFKEIGIEKGSKSAWNEEGGETISVTKPKKKKPEEEQLGKEPEEVEETIPAPLPTKETEDVEPIVGDVPKKTIVKVAKTKREEMGTRNLKNAVKSVVGTCLSAGLTIEEKEPKKVLKDINKGEWDSLIKKSEE